jgi:hypothetical protein
MVPFSLSFFVTTYIYETSVKSVLRDPRPPHAGTHGPQLEFDWQFLLSLFLWGYIFMFRDRASLFLPLAQCHTGPEQGRAGPYQVRQGGQGGRDARYVGEVTGAHTADEQAHVTGRP